MGKRKRNLKKRMEAQEESKETNENVTILHEKTDSRPREEVAPPSPIVTKTIGDYLKEKREEKDLSLKLISQHTKISFSTLQYLEQNEFDKLPNRAYVKGFIKSYSKVLGLDEKYCLEIFNQSFGPSKLDLQTENLKKMAPLGQTSSSEVNFPIKMIAAAVGVILIIILASLFSGGENTDEQEQSEASPIKTQELTADTPLKNDLSLEVRKESPVKEPPLSQETNAQSPKTKVSQEPQEDKKEPPKVVEEVTKEQEAITQKATPPADKTEEDKKEESKDDKEKVSFYTIKGPLYTVKENYSQEEVDTYVDASFQQSVIPSKQNVFVKAVTGDVWLTYKKDNDPIKVFVLKKGRGVLIRGDLIRAFVGNYAAAKYFLNNKPLQVKSPSGVKSLVFPQSQRDQFKFPLFIYEDSGKVITSEEYIQKQN